MAAYNNYYLSKATHGLFELRQARYRSQRQSRGGEGHRNDVVAVGTLAQLTAMDSTLPGAAAAVATYRRNRGKGGLGGTQAEHEDETAGAFEQVELFTRRGQDALNDLRAAPSTATRRRALEALDMLSFWTGRAHQSQTHGNPLHKKGGVNPVNAAVSLQADLRRALAACPCSTRTSR